MTDYEMQKIKGTAFCSGYNTAISKYEDQLNYAKSIIKDLLNNSDEYCKQRAIDFLEEDKNNG